MVDIQQNKIIPYPKERRVIIDYSSLNDKTVILSLGQACKKDGFFYLSNFGLSRFQRNEVFKQAKLFFNQPSYKKNLIKLEKTYPYMGYVARNEEDNVYHKAKENYERLYLINFPDTENKWPTDLFEFKHVFQEYIALMVRVGQRVYDALLCYCFDGKDKPDTHFDVESSISRTSINHYPFSGIASENISRGIETHRDNSLFNIFDKLTANPQTQLLSKEGTWYSIPAISGTMMVTIGTMLETISDGLYHPPLHRALSPASSGNNYTLVSAIRPNAEAIIRPYSSAEPQGYLSALETVNYNYSLMYSKSN